LAHRIKSFSGDFAKQGKGRHRVLFDPAQSATARDPLSSSPHIYREGAMVIEILRQHVEEPSQLVRTISRAMEAAMTTTQDEPCHFVTKVIEMFGDWFKQYRELNELMEYEFEFGELERVAYDLNVTTADLERLVNRD
jgi:hypothetical protein